MWLLDVNVPRQVAAVLRELGIPAETAEIRDWNTLTNGELVEAGARSGFECLLTRDRSLGESASHSLKSHPEFAVVVINLPQVRGRAYVERFRVEWNQRPISPVPGEVSTWS